MAHVPLQYSPWTFFVKGRRLSSWRERRSLLYEISLSVALYPSVGWRQMAKSTVFSQNQTTHPPGWLADNISLMSFLGDGSGNVPKNTVNISLMLWIDIFKYFLIIKQCFLEWQQWGMKHKNRMCLSLSKMLYNYLSPGCSPNDLACNKLFQTYSTNTEQIPKQILIKINPNYTCN